MTSFGKPFRIFTITEKNSNKRFGRFRKKRDADARAKQLNKAGKEVTVVASNCWYVDLRSPGYRNSVRSTKAVTCEEARTVVESWRAAEYKKEEQRRNAAFAPPQLMWRPVAFKVAAEAFIKTKEIEGLTESTMYDINHYFNNRFMPEFGRKMVHEVEIEDVEAYFRKRSRTKNRRGKTPSSFLLRRERGILRQFYKWAMIRRHAIQDPTISIKIPKPLLKENRILDAEEAAALLEACKQPYKVTIKARRNTGSRRGGSVTEDLREYSQTFTPKLWLYDIVVLALSTGLRLGNLINLTWKQVDLKKKRIDLPSISMKNRRPFTVYLNQNAFEILEKRKNQKSRKQKDRVFPHIDHRTVERAFHLAIKRAKIKPLRFHDLRKTCASWLAAAGVNLNAVMAVTGHQTLDVTLKHYLNVTESQRRDAVAKIRLPSE